MMQSQEENQLTYFHNWTVSSATLAHATLVF